MSRLGVAFTTAITSPQLRRIVRRWHGLQGSAELHYFHDTSDPYGALTAALLPALLAAYAVRLQPHLVPPPSAAFAPDRLRLQRWSLRDAEQWRVASGLLPHPLQEPSLAQLAQAREGLAVSLRDGDFATVAGALSAALWCAGELPTLPSPTDLAGTDERQGEAEQRRRGGYLGASFWFRGEWFWGLDRLPRLLEQLHAAGLQRGPLPFTAPTLTPKNRTAIRPYHGPDTADAPVASQRSPAVPVLDFWCSLRSPYPYLALPRIRAWATSGAVEVRLRPVLPMVMRGLAVPLRKRLFILRDAKREAEHLGLPFGRVADPIGRPTERGLAILHEVLITDGTLAALDFAESFLRGVFAEGIDAGSDSGLAHLAARAHVAPATRTRALHSSAWRAAAESHREALLATGLWGVPTFQVPGFAAQWGQDRLDLIEQQWRAFPA